MELGVSAIDPRTFTGGGAGGWLEFPKGWGGWRRAEVSKLFFLLDRVQQRLWSRSRRSCTSLRSFSDKFQQSKSYMFSKGPRFSSSTDCGSSCCAAEA